MDLTDMLSCHSSKDNDITIAISPSEKTSTQEGNCFYNLSGRVISFSEKNDVMYDKNCSLGINIGVYLFKTGVFKNIKVENKSLEKDFIPSFLREKEIKMFSYVVNSEVIDIGIANKYKELIKRN